MIWCIVNKNWQGERPPCRVQTSGSGEEGFLLPEGQTNRYLGLFVPSAVGFLNKLEALMLSLGHGKDPPTIGVPPSGL